MEFWGGYVLGFLATALVGALMTHLHSSARDRRTGARLVLLSPVWPLPAAVALVRGIAAVWRLADWKRP